MRTQKKYFKSLLFFNSDYPFSIKRFRHHSNQFNENTIHNREFWKIIYINEGYGWKVIGSKKYPLKPGSIFIIHPEDNTTFIIESDYIDIYNIMFMPKLISPMINDLSDDFHFFSIFHQNFQEEISSKEREWLHVLEADKVIAGIIKSLEKEYENQAPNYQNAIRFKLLDLLICISRLSLKKVKAHRESSSVQFIDHIIERYYSEDFNFDNLASEIGLTKSHICRMYKAATGITISQALRNKRLLVAKELLETTDKTISEICYECGFNDLSYFYRAFKKTTGLNPGSYRETLESSE